VTLPPMAAQLVPDDLWATISPLLPPRPAQPDGGRPWVEDRAVLGGVVYRLRARVPWSQVPTQALGCGSRSTCQRRLQTWQHAGAWPQVHKHLLAWLADDPPPRLTAADTQALVDRYHAGERPAALAREFGVSKGLVHYYARRYAPT
jgi:transposase